MEKISGYITSIVYRNPDNGYTVCGFMTDDTEETIVGFLPDAGEGEMLEVEGEWTIHKVYDRQFKVSSYKTITPEDEAGMIRYLGSGIIKGIGPTLAKRIVDEFGTDSFRVIEEEPERLERIKGISLSKAREIGILMQEKRGYRDCMIYLQKYGIGNTLAIKLYNKYGDRIYKIIQDNPYKLAEEVNGVGFKTADDIAAKVGFAPDSDYRIRSGILYTLLLALNQGHIYLPREILIPRAADVLSVPPEAVEPHIMNLVVDKKLVIRTNGEGDDREVCVYAAPNFYAERQIAGMLRNLSGAMNEVGMESEKRLRNTVNEIADAEGVVLDPLQEEAVINAIRNGISIITGGPGTGKTTTIKTLLGYFSRERMDIALAAPTGRAAKRMTEATGYEAKTLHRLLELNAAPDEELHISGFGRNEDNPLEFDAIIVDEMSMVDIFLMQALLKAVEPGTRLILVGDADQLPSVGPGQVLKDLIESNCFPVTRLETVYRQAGSGDIVLNAHRINKGEMIEPDNQSKDFFLLKRSDSTRILANMAELVMTNLPPYVGATPFDIQVLTPMRKGALGVEALNRYLQGKLNPPEYGKREHQYGEITFREGDKVMQIKNNYKLEWTIFGKYNIPTDSGLGVFNGDMGRITKIDTGASELTVEFDDSRVVVYNFSDLDELELAYAITVHKSQGSEYSAVVMPLLSGPTHLFSRNLLYTGITRAKKCLVILGELSTVHEMIANNDENRRFSGLRDRIIEVMSD